MQPLILRNAGGPTVAARSTVINRDPGSTRRLSAPMSEPVFDSFDDAMSRHRDEHRFGLRMRQLRC
jgi:hypothetical protein